MRADGKSLGGIGGGEADAERKAAANALGDGCDIRRNARVLEGEEAAGPPHAGLHFVADQQQAMLVAKRPQAAQECGRNNANPTLALNRFDHDRCGMRADSRLDRVEIGDRDLVKADRLGAETLQIFRLSAGCERRQSAPVESALEGQDMEPLGMAGDGVALARHLDRGLVGLRAGVREEYEIGEGRVGEPMRESLPSGIWNRFEVCQSFEPWVINASTRCGCECPSEATAMPAPKSR